MSNTEEQKLTCPVCAASKRIQGASVQGGDLTGYVNVNGTRLTKWGDRVGVSALSTVQAKVCGECGYIALFAENPALLWDTFCKIGR